MGGIKKQWHFCGETVEEKKKHKIAAVLYPYRLGKEEKISVEYSGDEGTQSGWGKNGFGLG